MAGDNSEHWERTADEWIAWTRAPGHDMFWAYRDAFRRFLPPAGQRTLEVGCGEGRIARELTDLGHLVTATDLSPRLLAAAQETDSAADYRRADATRLPFPDDSFDRVVAYNMLMDVPDMPAAVREAGRVLAPGGVLTISIVHPFIERGELADDAAFTIPGDSTSYFESSEFTATDTRDGLTMHFHGWSHPLQAYTEAHGAGLVITRLLEPRPTTQDSPEEHHLERWRRLPLFLWINATGIPRAVA